LYKMHDLPRAATTLRANVELREKVMAANPDDRRAADRLAYALRDLGEVELAMNQRSAARRDLLHAVNLYTRLARTGPLVAQSLLRFAVAENELGKLDRENACGWFLKAVALADEYRRKVNDAALPNLYADASHCSGGQ
jgi:hypothetical protein